MSSDKKFTRSSLERIKATEIDKKKIDFKNSLLRLTRLRDHPEKITDRDKSDFMKGPPKDVKLHLSQLDSIKNIKIGQVSSTERTASVTSKEINRRPNQTLNS